MLWNDKEIYRNKDTFLKIIYLIFTTIHNQHMQFLESYNTHTHENYAKYIQENKIYK